MMSAWSARPPRAARCHACNVPPGWFVGELPAARFADALWEHPLDEQQAAAQDHAEQAVHDGGLELDEGVVLQPDGEAAEHQHEEFYEISVLANNV